MRYNVGNILKLKTFNSLTHNEIIYNIYKEFQLFGVIHSITNVPNVNVIWVGKIVDSMAIDAAMIKIYYDIEEPST